MNDLAVAVHRLLVQRAETVATAESLTGGGLGAALTSVPGASATYRGGLIVYATDLKARLAGVSLQLLKERGAVDADVAAALAVGTQERLSASWAVGLTGVAGPDPQDGVAVGTVYVGIAGPDRPATAVKLSLAGDRQAIREAAVDAALRMLRDSLAAAEYRG